MDAPEPDRSRAEWRTSSYSNNGGACVQVAANLPGIVAVRDSKNPTGPALTFTPAQWRDFTTAIRHGELTAGGQRLSQQTRQALAISHGCSSSANAASCHSRARRVPA